ncbi:DUF4389 domain-containing protein [Salibacter halophilus]|uniref:DUF4389 domain-containing protein n=1 Tax=Salibacter halophilus TaxID=1803916 RepID=A0A6N6M900_9FLAO|nr:DUF4389 domain-containing protein [Salibacter halophilus]KAB1064508.1 DUF4389 domain-containing protein [Salibacter halophilus]
MRLEVKHQQRYSRLELLARSILGPLYIAVPHVIVLAFVSVAAFFHYLKATFTILRSGEYPQDSHSFLTSYLHWAARLHLRVFNMNDGYPNFGIKQNDPYLTLDFDKYDPDRKKTLLRTIFGLFYIFIPHIIVWFLGYILSLIGVLIAFFIVLFTGKYPAGLHRFQVGTLRWMVRVLGSLFHLEDSYPAFSGSDR